MTDESLTREYFRAHLENLVAMGQAAQAHDLGATPKQLVAAIEGTLLEIVRTSFPLEHLLFASDLVMHAEGPAVRGDAPSLSAFNWIAGTTDRALRRFAGAMFDLLERDAKNLAEALDLRLTGMAPGSLYIGFALAAPPSDLISEYDEPVFKRLREAIRRLPTLTDAIGDEVVDPVAAEIVPDAAERDAALNALHRMSPTGRRGVHTIDITSPASAKGSLSQRERVVLADALKNPNLANRRNGAFSGEIREIDLDARRFHLRGVEHIGRLRCVVGDINRGKAKEMIGEFVRVTGEYETDREGRPRLMVVHGIEVLPRAQQPTLDVGA